MLTLREFLLKNNYKKIYSLYAISCCLFLFHSAFVLHYYLKYEKFEETSMELHWPLELPDVTVCDNLLVYPEEVAGKRSVFLKQNEMEYVRVLSYAKSPYFLTETATFSGMIRNCTYTDFYVPCKRKKHFNYFFGDCETISVGEKLLSDTPVTGIKFEGNVIEKYGYQFQRQPSFVLVLHPAETQPIFLRKNLIFGDYYGDYVIHLKKKVKNLIDCFKEEDVINKEIPGVIKNGTKYSYEACLTTCYQNFSMERCGCILPQFNFASNAYKYPVCRMCRGEFTLDLSELCACKPLCENVEWEWNVEDVKFVNESQPLTFDIQPPAFSAQSDAEEKDENKLLFRKFVESDVEIEEKYWIPSWKSIVPESHISHDRPSTFRVKVEYQTAEVTIVMEKLLLKKISLIGTIAGSCCLFFGTNALRALLIIALEIFNFYSQTKRKLKLLNKSVVILCLNMRRGLVVTRQLLWLLPTIGLTVLSAFLIKDLIDDYLNFSTLQHPSIDWNRNFPAVTVCSGVPLIWQELRSHDPDIWMENRVQQVSVFHHKNANQSDFIRRVVKEMRAIQSGLRDTQMGSFSHLHLNKENYYDKILPKFQTGSREDRSKFGIKMDDYIKKCTWSYSGLSYNCSQTQFVQFNNHKYGSCATFNHGSLSKEDNDGPIDGVEMILSWNQLPLAVIKSLTGAPGLMVHVHERGTAPLFIPSTTHLIRGFSFNHITFTAEKHLLSSRNCALHGQHAHMKENSAYGDENRQYKHTIKSCLESCFQKITHEEPRCRSCYQALMLGKYDKDEESVCTTFCLWVDEELLSYKCDCKQNCDSVEFNTQITANNFIKTGENTFNITDKRDNPRFKSGYGGEDVFILSNRTIYPDGNCGFKISAGNNFENVIYETQKTKLVNVLGLIGGIMGFLQALLSIYRSLRIFITQSP